MKILHYALFAAFALSSHAQSSGNFLGGVSPFKAQDEAREKADAYAKSIANDPTRSMPYHPYRKVGDRYYSIQAIYDHKPMTDWLVAKDYGADVFKVLEILPAGVRIQYDHYQWNAYSQKELGFSHTYFLTNYPFKDRLIDGQVIEFIALRSGNHQYQDEANVVHTIPLYDYGIPYNPYKLAADRARTNAPAH